MLLCTDYKRLPKVMANRLENFMELIVHRSNMDNLLLIRNLLDVCKLHNIDFGIVSLDQEKAFDRIDQKKCFHIDGF